MRRPLPLVLAALAVLVTLLVLPRGARAQTIVPGGNILNQTWTPAGSPYIVQGDAIVPVGSTLTIQAGTTVQLASSDGQISGLDTSRVELTIKGTLLVSGTAANPVNFQAASGVTANIWYGIVIDPLAASASITGAVVRHAVYGIRSSGSGAVLSVTDSTFHTSGYGIYLDAGSPTLAGVTAYTNSYGFYVAGSAGATITSCIAHSNTSDGIHIRAQGGASTTTTVTGCTVHANSSYGIYVRGESGSSATATIKDSNVTQNGIYGIYRYTSSGTANVTLTYSNVWQNASGDLVSVAAGAGCLSANPLYVSAPGNLRLTSNSPSRFAGDAGGDLGPLPYTGDPTSGLHGTLWVNTTLNLAGSPYPVAGDLTVPQGVTLTIQPGVTLQFTTSDVMISGDDTSRGELRVEGTLTAVGTVASPIVLTSTGSSANTWYGVVLRPTASNTTLAHATVNEAVYAVRNEAAAATNAFHHLNLHTSGYGFYANAGPNVIDAITAYSNSYGAYLTGSAGGTLTNAVLRNNTSDGLHVRASGGASTTVSLTNSTVHANSSYGIYVRGESGSSATATVKNSIVTQNGIYGIYRYTSSGTANVTLTYSNVWSNSSGDLVSVVAGAGCIASNPLYVSPPGDLSLQGTSVCVDAGTANGAPNHDRNDVVRPLNGDGLNGAEFDMGAYEYVTAALCGDSIVSVGEVCDEGALNGTYGHCKADCSGLGPRCGDGIVNGPETCDDANASNTDACLNTCVTATCGDGYVRAGVEQCDDANAANTDACLNTCVTATCGDGFVRAGVEQCDDANASNTDACLNTCASATCGDGFVRAGVEQCDDGNQLNTDACVGACVPAACGDGFVQTGVEQCDDGNMVNGDACPNSCQLPSCGDGIVQAGVEQCDDGNQLN
ncbi:MAG: DUF4215 domain-containing protein, partial [Polyangiaceae bacterium]|nr:DUF4215 domain-containing protein [Polyangiaceae bacterium]